MLIFSLYEIKLDFKVSWNTGTIGTWLNATTTTTQVDVMHSGREYHFDVIPYNVTGFYKKLNSPMVHTPIREVLYAIN